MQIHRSNGAQDLASGALRPANFDYRYKLVVRELSKLSFQAPVKLIPGMEGNQRFWIREFKSGEIVTIAGTKTISDRLIETLNQKGVAEIRLNRVDLRDLNDFFKGALFEDKLTAKKGIEICYKNGPQLGDEAKGAYNEFAERVNFLRYLLGQREAGLVKLNPFDSASLQIIKKLSFSTELPLEDLIEQLIVTGLNLPYYLDQTKAFPNLAKVIWLYYLPFVDWLLENPLLEKEGEIFLGVFIGQLKQFRQTPARLEKYYLMGLEKLPLSADFNFCLGELLETGENLVLIAEKLKLRDSLYLPAHLANLITHPPVWMTEKNLGDKIKIIFQKLPPINKNRLKNRLLAEIRESLDSRCGLAGDKQKFENMLNRIFKEEQIAYQLALYYVSAAAGQFSKNLLAEIFGLTEIEVQLSQLVEEGLIDKESLAADALVLPGAFGAASPLLDFLERLGNR